MRVCSSCGRQNADDRDFCDCGEYLRWEPTDFMPAVDASQVTTPPPPGAPPAAAPPSSPPPAASPPPPAASPPPPAAAAARPATAGAPPSPAPGPAAAPAAPGAAGPAAVEAPLASITLRVPDVEGTPGDTVAVGCDPGGRVRVLALVRNASGIVDNYTLEVSGLPPGWYTVVPNPVYLVPFGTAGSYEQEVEVQLHPPRAPDAQARIWDLQVVAHSAAHQRPVASAPLVLGIQPYEEFEPRLKPEKASGRRRASYDVTVRNKANAPVMVALGIADPEDALRAEFGTRRLEVPPGETRTSRLDVRPPRQVYVGRPVEHRFEVLARTGEEAEEMLAAEARAAEAPDDGKGAGDGEGASGLAGRLGLRGPRVQVGPSGVRAQAPRGAVRPPSVPSKSFGLDSLRRPAGAAPAWTAPLLPTQAVFRQKPWVPRWVVGLLLALLLAAVLVFLLLPRNATVPDVVGKTVLDATTAIERAELTVNPKVGTQVSRAAPGTIIRQTLEPGSKVAKGRSITLVQAVGTEDVKVPDIVGRELGAASSALERARLTVGATNPAATSPRVKIKSTIPAAGEVVKEGKAVQLFLAVPAGGEGEGERSEERGTAGEAPSGPVALPATAGQTAEAAGAALAGAGVSVDVVKRFTDRAPAGEVFDQRPPAGEEVSAGSTVRLFVSLGIPRIAYDTDDRVVIVNGIDGKGRRLVSRSAERQLQPSFNSTGTALLFVSDGQVKLVDLTKPDDLPADLTTEGEWRLPTFAPTPQRNVVAALKIDPETGGGPLCIGPLTASGFEPECLARPKDVAGFASSALHWAPDGTAIFALGVLDDGSRGIFRFRTEEPFSSDADDWSRGRLMTSTEDPSKYVFDLAISPDGKTMAVTSNLRSDRVQLYLAKPQDFELEQAEPLPVAACTVSWRPDSGELAVVQATDCGRPGEIARVSLDDPRRPFTLGVFGDAPVYSPARPETGAAP